jgi:salicylate hydroxylase
VSFLNGAVWHLPDGPAQQARDEVMKLELERKPFKRSSNTEGDPRTILEVYTYDAEEHADEAIFEFLKGREQMSCLKGIMKAAAGKYELVLAF